MNQPIFVCLGRAGDVINILPLLKKESDAGRRCALMTQSPFDEILQGVTYADCLITPVHGNVAETVAAAKKLSNDVRCVHVSVTPEETKSGKFENIKTDSWAKEAFRLAGHMDLWKENLPLVFDKRDSAREAALIPDFVYEGKPTILLATGGVSSPFQYASLLRGILDLRFRKPNWRIIDIGKVKAHRLYDLIGLMEKARFLVTTDSAPMHLARAVPTLPVVALTNDRPGLWNGSPWRPEHIWTCRYADFPRRAMSMIEAMDNLYSGVRAFNPCLKRVDFSYIHTFSAYEGISDEAKENWTTTYGKSERWIQCPAWFGVFGRDSRYGGVPGEKSRFPFVKDVIRIAVSRSKQDNDVIILTRGDTCFNSEFSDDLKGPFYSHRCTKDANGNLTHNPAIDLFAFTVKWWRDHVSECPDFIMGKDYFWQRCLKALILKYGGREVPFLTYQSKGKE